MFESKELLRKVDYLESERKKLWERVTFLEKEVKIKASDYEKDAKHSSKKAAEFRNKAEERRDSIEELYNQSKSILDSLISLHSTTSSIKDSVVSEQASIGETVEKLVKDSNELESKIATIDDILEEYPNLDEDIAGLNTQLKSSQENSHKISTLLKLSTEKKNDIDGLYLDIAGYDEENDETGEIQHIEGLKDKLEGQYSILDQKLKDLRQSFDKLFNEKNKETDEAISGWNEKHSALNSKIESLLPNALTAGLSYAYSNKKDKEIEVYEKLKTQFSLGIVGLTAISSLTVFISIYFIATGTPFRDVIKLLPNIAVAIIPLYIPMLWFTFAANKKVNLSKRLIEEYTHKEVISKTFEGLSTQIENLEDSEISKDLRLKLLFNLLEISTENPGKLISDYKNSDHPLLEVLKQQSVYERALARAKEFPDLNKLSEIVNSSKDKKVQMERFIDDVAEIAQK